MHTSAEQYDVIVIGGGHAGAEAAWTASNLGCHTALITMACSKIGQMSCNPAIGGLAKGQMVREIDALGGLMALAIDATGIQFRTLNASKGAAVQGPRAQADKYAYAKEVQRLLETRRNLTILEGTIEDIRVDDDQRVRGVIYQPTDHDQPITIDAPTVILTTGTFMRGLMHTGESQTPGGRVGEAAANRISACLLNLGFELGRLKTGTCPRLDIESLHLEDLPAQPGDDPPLPFSDMTGLGLDAPAYARIAERFPVIEQRPCWITRTNQAIHDRIRDNLHRAPMYNGQIQQTVGPRYCPSIEDKIVKFPDKQSHQIFLEPESLSTNEIYCNGIPTSLPGDVQDFIVHHMLGCEDAKILRYGYAVEYDMVWPYQIDATTMTKTVRGLFLAGQINGTSGYEEAAGQGLLAGLNAARLLGGHDMIRLGRDQAYIGVMMDDLVTKIPREPYRMFSSRAEHRLMLRADNAAQRLTPLAEQWGLIDEPRRAIFKQRMQAIDALRDYLKHHRTAEGQRLEQWARTPNVDTQAMLDKLNGDPLPELARDRRTIAPLLSDMQYEGFIRRHQQQWQRVLDQEHRIIPGQFDYDKVPGLRTEARQTLDQFRPSTLGQASRLAGITPADLTTLMLTLDR